MVTISAPTGKATTAVAERNLSKTKWFFSCFFLVLLLTAVLYIAVAATAPKFNRAEVFFAECAREMLRDNNFVTPLYHSKPFFDKPILTYWFILGCFKTFGVSHFVSRIPSITAAVSTVSICALGIALALGAEAGLLTGIMLASAAMFVSFAALCMSDMLLVLLDTVTLVLLFGGIQLVVKQRTILWWLASLSIGLAFLTKGPVGLVLPAVSFLAYLTVTKQLSLIKLQHFLFGALTIVAVNMPWFLAALKINGPGALYYFFVHENLQRFASSTYDTHRPLGFMVSSLFAGFLPWSILLPFVFIASMRKFVSGIVTTRSKLELYLWIWVVCVIGFFSISRGKIDYYALPAYPACAALCGMYLSDWINQKSKLAIIMAWGLALSFIAMGLVSCFYFSSLIGSAQIQYMLVPSILIMAGLFAAWAAGRNKLLMSYGLIFAGVVFSGIGFSLQILPIFSKLQAPLKFAEVIKHAPGDAKIGMYKNVDNWIDELTFQTGKEPIKLNSTDELAAFMAGSKPAFAVVSKDIVDHLPAQIISKIKIVDEKPFMSHSLNPGYILKNKGHLADDTLMLISNVF